MRLFEVNENEDFDRIIGARITSIDTGDTKQGHKCLSIDAIDDDGTEHAIMIIESKSYHYGNSADPKCTTPQCIACGNQDIAGKNFCYVCGAKL